MGQRRAVMFHQVIDKLRSKRKGGAEEPHCATVKQRTLCGFAKDAANISRLWPPRHSPNDQATAFRTVAIRSRMSAISDSEAISGGATINVSMVTRQ